MIDPGTTVHVSLQTVLVGGGILAAIALLFGPEIWRGLKLVPALAKNVSLDKRRYFGTLIAALFLGVWLGRQGIAPPNPDPNPQPDPDPVEPEPEPRPEPDVLDLSYQKDRGLRVSMLREMAGLEFGSDSEMNDWHTEQSRDILQAAYRPYLDELAVRITSGTLTEFASELESGN